MRRAYTRAAEELVLSLVEEDSTGVVDIGRGGWPRLFAWADGHREYLAIMWKEEASWTHTDQSWDYGIEPDIWEQCCQADRKAAATLFVYDRGEGTLYFAAVADLMNVIRDSKNPTKQPTMMIPKDSFSVYTNGLKARFNQLVEVLGA